MIFFMHIPKTAGSSFRTILFETYGKDKFFPSNEDIKNNPGIYTDIELMKKKLDGRISAEVIAGHFWLHAFDYSKENTPYKVVTFLRNPIERTISHLQHAKERFPNFKNHSLRDIFEEVPYFSCNLQTHYFSKDFKRNVPPDARLYDEFDEIKLKLNSLFFVGITENFKNSLKLLEKKLKINLKPEMKINTAFNQALVDKDLMKDIIKNNELDFILYKEACSMLRF